MSEAEAAFTEALKCLSEPLDDEKINVKFIAPESGSYGPWILCIEDHMRPPTKSVLLSELVRGKHKYAYEVLGDDEKWLIPFFDWEEYRDCEELVTRDKWRVWEKCIARIKEKFGDNCNIVGLDACGKKGVSHIISFHAFVRGAGAYKCGKDMMRAGIVPDGFDQSVYKGPGSRQLFRMAGMSKAGEDRPFRYVVNRGGGGWDSVDVWELEPEQRKKVIMSTLVQYSEGEEHIEVESIQHISAPVSISGEGTVMGVNGLALGSDIVVTKESVKELCVLAGWFTEVDRGFEKWRDEMWLLQNTADDFGMADELDELMIEVSAVHPTKHSDGSVESIKRVTKNRSTQVERKNLGQLRKDVLTRDEEGYFRWLAKFKKPTVVEQKDRDPMMFSDHNTFVGKRISLQTAEAWLNDCIVMVMNGGDPYFLTRNRRICEHNNRKYDAWMHAKQDKMLGCLNVGVFIRNPNYNPDLPSGESNLEFKFTTFGNGSMATGQGFLSSYIYNRQLNWVDHEDFIPYLDRRIPDVNIERAVRDKRLFNKFRGYPIAETQFKDEGPQFLGSAWHRHLVNDICHGDETEWKHLEASIADMIQRPYRVPNVAHVFQSDQGTGKRHFFDFMSDMLGAAHVMYIEDMGNYMQKFNEDQSMAILKVFEEVKGKGDSYVNNDRLKCDITKTVIRIEIKNGAILNMRHCSRYWFFTNHRDTLHVEASDRRLVYHSISNEHANDWDYFEPIVDELRNVDYIRACFEYFAELPYEEKLVMNAITTDYKNEQKLDSLSLPLSFVREFMEDGMIEGFNVMERDGDKVNSVAFFEMFGRWCVTNRHTQCSLKAFYKSVALVGISSKNGRINGGDPEKIVTLNNQSVRNGFSHYLKMPGFEWRE